MTRPSEYQVMEEKRKGIIHEIISLQERLDQCNDVRKMIPVVEDFLRLLYRITGELPPADLAITRKVSSGTNARNMERGSSPNTNRSRIGPVGSGKVARTKKQRNSERKLNETFSL